MGDQGSFGDITWEEFEPFSILGSFGAMLQ
jgi:hypothetical protein